MTSQNIKDKLLAEKDRMIKVQAGRIQDLMYLFQSYKQLYEEAEGRKASACKGKTILFVPVKKTE